MLIVDYTKNGHYVLMDQIEDVVVLTKFDQESVYDFVIRCDHYVFRHNLAAAAETTDTIDCIISLEQNDTGLFFEWASELDLYD